MKLEYVAEETGELIGKGIKKTWRVVKSFGKGVADTLERETKDNKKRYHLRLVHTAVLQFPETQTSVPHVERSFSLVL